MIKEIAENRLGERPSWDEYFMGLAILTASRSSCKHVEAGSVIVQDKQVVGMGYNGAPSNLENCLDVGCRKDKLGLEYRESLNTGTCIGIHSEMNALGHLKKIESRGIELYTTIFPCHDCAKNLLPYGLDEIVFKSLYDNEESQSTFSLFEEAGVEIFRLNLSPKRLLNILFNRDAKDFGIWDPKDRETMNKLSNDVFQPQ